MNPNNYPRPTGGPHDDVSPLVGQTVTVAGVVVADFQSIPQPTRTGEIRGFFLEEEDEDHDADDSTSEGIFVFSGSVSPIAANAPLPTPSGIDLPVVGDLHDFYERYGGMWRARPYFSWRIRAWPSTRSWPSCSRAFPASHRKSAGIHSCYRLARRPRSSC